MLQNALKTGRGRTAACLLGSLIYALGINLFVAPMEIYTGGIMGLCQLLRTLALTALHMDAGGFDFAGLIYCAVNVPLLVLAWRTLGRRFFFNTLLCVAANTVFLSVIPVPAGPLVDDPLTGCLLGGVISGVGIGMSLTGGGCSGGVDIVSLYLAKRGRNFTVGQFNLVFNAVLFAACGLLYGPSVMIYSFLNTIFHSLAVDRAHRQSVTVQALIFTRVRSEEMNRYVTENLHRGVTMWEGRGMYTGEEIHVVCVCMNKFEVDDFREALRRFDPGAFFVIQEGVHVGGNFDRRLS